jgi:hypothetical protein
MTRITGTLQTDTEQYQITVKVKVKSGKYASDKIPFGKFTIEEQLLSVSFSRLIAIHTCSGVLIILFLNLLLSHSRTFVLNFS